MQQILINKQTAAVTSNPFYLDGSKAVGLKCTGVAGAEVVNLQVQVGDIFQNVLDSTGAAVTFTSTNKPITVTGSGTFQVVKPSTAAAVTIQLD